MELKTTICRELLKRLCGTQKCTSDLRRAFRPRVFSLIQLVPALHQFNHDGPAKVHQLETRHVGSAVHEPLQRNVLKTLKKKEKRKIR